MRIPFYGKMAFLALLGMASYWVSSTFFAMPGEHAAIASATSAAISPDAPSITETPSAASGTLPMRGDSSGIAASFSVEEREFIQQGQSAYVFAKLRIQDRRPNARYTWSLVAREDLSREIVHKHIYEDQVFSPPDEQDWSPTFTDLIDLPPGDYSVRLTLHDLPRGMDPIVFDDEEFATSQNLLSVLGHVSIR